MLIWPLACTRPEALPALAPAPVAFSPTAVHHSGLQPAGYGCVHHDEFECATGACDVDPSRWRMQATAVNGELQHYTTQQCADPAHADDWNLCVRDGSLHIRARDLGVERACGDGVSCAPDYGLRANEVPRRYTSGRIMSKNLVFERYGYLEVGVRTPARTGSGLWPSMFLLGNRTYDGWALPAVDGTDLSWPSAGEIDVFELFGREGYVAGNLHWEHDGHRSCSNRRVRRGGLYPAEPECDYVEGDTRRGFVIAEGASPSEWRIVGLRWTPERLDWYADGRHIGGKPRDPEGGDEELDLPAYWILNLAVGGFGGGAVDPGLDWSAAEVEFAYVRWYQAGAPDHCGIDGPAVPRAPRAARAEPRVAMSPWMTSVHQAEDVAKAHEDTLTFTLAAPREAWWQAQAYRIVAPGGASVRLRGSVEGPDGASVEAYCEREDATYAPVVPPLACAAGPCELTCPLDARGAVRLGFRAGKTGAPTTVTAVTYETVP